MNEERYAGLVMLKESITVESPNRTFIEGTLSGALHEVVNEGSFVFLQRAVNYLENLQEDDENLVNMEKHNQEMLKKIQKVIAEEKMTSERILQEKSDLICKIKDEINDEKEIEKVIKNYVKHWEKSTQEQLLMRLSNGLNDQNEKLKRLARDLEDEETTNESLTKYLTLACNDLTEQIARWKEQYERDLEAIEATIADLKAAKEVQSKTYRELEKEFNLRQGEMDEFLAMKAERKRREAHEKFEHDCAVRLQAWWRGLMVRRCLGQFRRRKKAAGGKESAKQKKGKGK
ncbi:dynein regulatory complex protein 9 [Hetaerina americana]|uniref:dynein regulatory complex protein 9 n=1 Tax=Hetaerina americana TaxID=62018 RepID=UPI003A7F23EC